MRIPIALLAAALTLAACGARQERTATLEPRTPSSIRLYGSTLPRCPYRELGTVNGRYARDIRSAAFGLRANAVLLDRQAPGSMGYMPLSGTAIQFLSVDCRR